MPLSRRELLRSAGQAMLLAPSLDRFPALLTSAFPGPSIDANYKALVCVFLFGGNDGNNTVIPYDDYASYQAVRSTAAQLGIPRDQLLQIAPPSTGRAFGLHPSLAGLLDLWSQRKLAIVANVGTLVRPITKDDYRAGIGHPRQLFSQLDQQNEWQTANATSPSRTGWGGRLADRVGKQALPIVTSTSGVAIFGAGEITRSLVFPPAPARLDQQLQLARPEDAIGQGLALDQRDIAPTLVKANAAIIAQGLVNSETLRTVGDPTLDTTFPPTSLGNQLKQIAKLIKISPLIPGVHRQIFFASLGGFDTRSGQLSRQATLLTQLSQAVSAFYGATVELRVSSQVTTFTMSEFGRTFLPPNPGPNVGSDHGWGNHHFVLGDDVRGGEFYGAYPNLALGGQDDTDVGPEARGQWIPTTAVDQYAATLARWFGASEVDLAYIFPNIGSFGVNDLGFMAH